MSAAGLGFYCYQVYSTTCALLVGSKVTSCPHGEFISHLLALLQFASKTFEMNELEHEVPCHREATQANRDSGCLALCTL